MYLSKSIIAPSFPSLGIAPPIVPASEVFHTLMQHNLVDEYKLMLHPIILGSGKRLFDTKIDQTVLKLVGTQTFSSGIVILTYQPIQK